MFEMPFVIFLDFPGAISLCCLAYLAMSGFPSVFFSLHNSGCFKDWCPTERFLTKMQPSNAWNPCVCRQLGNVYFLQSDWIFLHTTVHTLVLLWRGIFQNFKTISYLGRNSEPIIKQIVRDVLLRMLIHHILSARCVQAISLCG